MSTIHQAEIVNDESNPELMPMKREQSEIVKLPEQRATPQELRTVEVNEALLPAYQKAATLELTEAEISALQAPFPDELVEIRPHDGLIYIPHIHISNRFNKVLKPGKWALICRRHWLEGNTMYGEYVLVVRGCYVGESVGGHPYQPNNPKVNYSDTLESTAAEALRRIAGKRLSCGSQVWEPEYARQWCGKHSTYTNGKYVRAFGQNAHSSPDTPPKQPSKAPEAKKTPPAPQNAPQGQQSLKTATPEQRQKMVSVFEGEGSDAVQRALGYFIETGAILPTEKLTDVPLEYVPTMASHMRELATLINQCNDQGKAVKPSWVFKVAIEDPKKKPIEQALPLEGVPDEAWASVIVPIPNKGQKRDDYLKNPDTIGSLYASRHGDDEESQAKRQRLWGFVHHYEPKGWTKKDGSQMPPSKSDEQFRAALDEFSEWFVRNHPDEKL